MTEGRGWSGKLSEIISIANITNYKARLCVFGVDSSNNPMRLDGSKWGNHSEVKWLPKMTQLIEGGLRLDFRPSESKASALVTFSLYLKFIHSANTFWTFPMFREEFRMLKETSAMKRKESSNIFRPVRMIDATLCVHPHHRRCLYPNIMRCNDHLSPQLCGGKGAWQLSRQLAKSKTCSGAGVWFQVQSLCS